MKPCPISAADICFQWEAGVDMPDAASWSCQDKTLNKVAIPRATYSHQKETHTHLNDESFCINAELIT